MLSRHDPGAHAIPLGVANLVYYEKFFFYKVTQITMGSTTS